MSLWIRVFGKSEQLAESSGPLEDAIRAIDPEASLLVKADANCRWLQIECRLTAAATPIFIEHFRRDEEGIRGELQAWAAWLETCDYSPNHEALMQHMISTQQVMTVRKPIDCANEVLMENVCLAVCRYLAKATDGIYQIDGEGFFAADGTLLLQEY